MLFVRSTRAVTARVLHTEMSGYFRLSIVDCRLFARPLGRVLLCTLAFASIVFADPPKHHNRSLRKLKQDHAAKMKKRHELTRQKHIIIALAHAKRREISAIDQDIGDLSAQLEETEARLEKNQMQQRVLSKELDKETVRLRKRSDQARLRLRQIYMHGNSSLASAIVGSKSLADFASRKFVFERIAQRDRQLFEEVRELQQRVVRRKQQVDQLVVQNRQDIQNVKSQKADLQRTREEKLGRLQELKDKEGELEQLIRDLDEEDAGIEAQIRTYEGGAGRALGAFHGRFMVPVIGARFTSGFGMRFHPILHRSRMHAGQDLAAPTGTPIHAAAEGIVIACRYTRGYGNMIVVDHGGGYSTLYGHCSRILVTPGQRVSRGEEIGLVGSTGLATGAHCHFEVRINGRPVNPMKYLR